jgi:hypothetical protein
MSLILVCRYRRERPNQCQPSHMVSIIHRPCRRRAGPFAALRWRRAACALLAVTCAACNNEDDVTGTTSRCASELFSSYNPKVMEQCVAVCKRCERGTTVTCTTSCNLKGAR